MDAYFGAILSNVFVDLHENNTKLRSHLRRSQYSVPYCVGKRSKNTRFVRALFSKILKRAPVRFAHFLQKMETRVFSLMPSAHSTVCLFTLCREACRNYLFLRVSLWRLSNVVFVKTAVRKGIPSKYATLL